MGSIAGLCMATSVTPCGLVVAVAVFGLTACAGDRGPTRQDAGQSAVGAAGNPTPTFGTLLGTPIGTGLDERDRERAYAAELRALKSSEPGVPVGWHSPDSGSYGTIVPGPLYQSNGMTCREFSHTMYIDGHPQTARGTACRSADGSWTPVG